MTSSETAAAQTLPAQDSNIVLRRPEIQDGAAVHALIASSPPLDVNSTYAYLLLCHHFRETCVVAEQNGKIVGFVSGYLPPAQLDTFFVWQVAVHGDARGRGLGIAMLRHLLERPAVASVRSLETTVSPSNHASRALFARLAANLDTQLTETSLFTRDMFGVAADHEDEMLLTIGPFH